MIRSVVSHFAAAAALLLVSSGTLLAQFSITSNTPSVNFSYATGTPGPLQQQITITSNSPSSIIYSAYTTSTAVSVTPSSGSVSTGGQTLTLSLDNPAAFASATTIQLNVSSLTSGVAGISIPVNIYPGGTGTGAYTAFPSSVTLNYTPGSNLPLTQSISVSGPSFGQYSVSFDNGTANQYLSVSPTTVTTGSSVTLTMNPVFAPTTVATTTNLRFTPISGTSALAAIVVPITLQPYGTSASNITASPASVSFSYPANTVGSLTQTVTLNAAVQTQLAPTFSANLQPYLNIPNAVSSIGSFQIVLGSPANVPGTINGTLTLAPTSTTTGLQPLTIAVSIVPGGTSGTSGINVTPAIIAFNYASGTTQQQSVQVQANSVPNVPLTASVSGLGNLVSVAPTVYTNSPFFVVLTSPALVTQAISGTLTLTPAAGSGLGTVTVPIQITPSGTSGTGLSTSPSSLNYSYAPGTVAAQTQYLLLSSPFSTTVTITPSANISTYFTYPSTAVTGSQIAFTIPNPSLVPNNVVGSFTISPQTTGLGSISVPVYINASSTGTNAIAVTPASVAFNMQSGGAAPAEQIVSLTDPNNINTFITVSVTSDNNFLQITQSSSSIPSTLTLRVDTSGVRQVGQYSGTVTVYRLSDRSQLATIPVTLNVTPAVKITPAPTSVNLSSVAGSTTAVTQAVQVNGDASGNFGTTVATTSGGAWLSVTPTGGAIGSSITVSANPSGLTQGTYQGTVTITISGAPATSIPVTLTVAQASALQLGNTSLNFTYQTGSASGPAAQSVTVASTTSGVALNYTATATSTGNWLSVTPASGTTPGSVSVSVNPAGLTVGTYTGTVSVASPTATNTPQSIAVTLTVTAPALPNITSVLSAASLAPTLTTPGGILTLRGTNLGPATGASGTVAGGMLQTTAGGVTVTFDGVAAPILYASATQLNVVAPYEVASRATTRVVVTYQGQSSTATDLRVTDTAPAIFTLSGGGTGQAAALNQNTSVNSTSNPESRGNIVVLFGTGEGVTNPASTTGQISDTLRLVAAPVRVRIGGQLADVLYVGSMPGAVAGAFQLNVRIPQNIGPGQQPVDVQIGAASSQASVTIAVQ